MSVSQLRKGVLDLIVLGELAREPAYGGALLDRINADPDFQVSSGTLYPILNRLKKGGSISSHWEESPAGPPRKVYELTSKGRTHLRSLGEEWRAVNAAVESLFKELRDENLPQG